MVGRKVGGEAVEERPLVDDRRIVPHALDPEPQALCHVLAAGALPTMRCANRRSEGRSNSSRRVKVLAFEDIPKAFSDVAINS
jgi:hypothetical protein